MNCLSNAAPAGAGAKPVHVAFKKAPVFLTFLLMVLSISLYAQQTVTGKVVVGDSALSGVSVTVKNAAIGTTTDASGSYSIKVPAAATLVFSYVGFAEQEIRVDNQNNFIRAHTGNLLSMGLPLVFACAARSGKASQYLMPTTQAIILSQIQRKTKV